MQREKKIKEKEFTSLVIYSFFTKKMYNRSRE